MHLPTVSKKAPIISEKAPIVSKQAPIARKTAPTVSRKLPTVSKKAASLRICLAIWRLPSAPGFAPRSLALKKLAVLRLRC